jgi:DNA-binding transcriptional LysR family regulator
MLMELRHLAHFVAVAEEASFTRASERLHVVQSAVSASIRGLERELGVQLFERTTQRVALTDAGQVFLPEARRTLAAADAAREAIDDVRGGLRGTVRLGTMQALRIVDVPRLLAQFHREHPQVELQVRHASGGSAQLADAVRHGELDLAILATRERRAPGLELTTLARETLEFTCHHQHRLVARKTIQLSDLAEETFIDFPLGWGLRTATDLAFAAAGVRRTVTMEIDDILELVRMVAAGLGVALLPPSIATNTELRTLRIRRHAPVQEVMVATPTVRRPSAATRTLLEAIVAHTR